MAEKPSKDKKKKRSRKRNVRTDVSSSESDSDVPTKVAQAKEAEGDDSDIEMTESRNAEVESESSANEGESLPSKQLSDADFNSWYLRQVTKELEEDLDKIRSASDFKDSSLSVLITALQQGNSLFSPEEKRRLLGITS